MARKSRVLNLEPMPAIQAHKEILTAIYVRKSIEDAESLDTQIELLKNYMNESDRLYLYKIYADNGFSGTNLKRPALKEMLEDMKAGKFRAVLVKDFSRLGRNYLETGMLIEFTFPEYGIRFISVNDHYDSAGDRAETDGVSLPLKNLANEQYSKDLSRKLSPAFRTKQMAGEYIGPYAPYGYEKSKADRHKLVIDEEAAPIVLRIFQMKATGLGNGAVASILNNEEILSPFAYRYQKGIVKAEKYKNMKWKADTIGCISKNQMYLGHMVQGVHRQSLSNREKARMLQSEEWIIVKNTHEPIVSQQLFDRVQNPEAASETQMISESNGYNRNKTLDRNEGILLPFKNLVNDYYVKSLSKNVKSAIRTRQGLGQFLSPHAIFGYKKSEKNLHELVPDEKTSMIVRRIFDMALEGKNGKEIAIQLNEDKIPTPGWFANQKMQRQYILDERTNWTSPKVYKILRDQRYAGDMVSNVRIRKRIANNETISTGESDRIFVPDAHQGIVTREEFYLVNEQRLPVVKRNNVTLGADRRKEVCVCPYCGRTLRRTSRGKNAFYCCVTDVYSNRTECSEIRMREEDILKTVTVIIQRYMDILLEKEAMIKGLRQRKHDDSPTIIPLSSVDNSIAVRKRKIISMHEKYRSGILTKKEFLLQKNIINQQIYELEQKKYQLANGMENIVNKEKLKQDMAEKIARYKEKPIIPYSDLIMFVDRVYVYKNKQMTVQFKFEDFFSPFKPQAEKVKAYLRKGAAKLPGFDQYPNPVTGYGKLCLEDSFPDKD